MLSETHAYAHNLLTVFFFTNGFCSGRLAVSFAFELNGHTCVHSGTDHGGKKERNGERCGVVALQCRPLFMSFRKAGGQRQQQQKAEEHSSNAADFRDGCRDHQH